MHEPAHHQATSIVGVIDATFRLYRAQFRMLLIALISVLGACMAVLLMFQFGNFESIDWTHLWPLRPETLIDAFSELNFGLDPFTVAWDHIDDVLLLLGVQTLLTGLVIGVVARGYLEPFYMALPARPRGLRGEIKLLPGVLAALPLSILGSLLAERLVGIVLLSLDLEEPLDLELVWQVWLNYGGQLLICLVLIALCARLLLAPQAAVLEQQRALASLRRSWQLTRRAFGRMFVAALVVMAVPALSIGSLTLIPYLVFVSTGAIDLYAPLLTVATLLGQALLALAYAFQIAFFTLLYYDLRFRAEGYDLVLQANRTATEQARTLVERGTARIESDDLAGARADFEQARAFLPDDRTVLSYCVSVKLRLDDPAGALKDCEHALALFPNDHHVLHCRGLARYRLGDLAGARADYDQALHLYPNEVIALINRAHLKHSIGEYDSAREDLLWALRYKPDEATAMYNIACGYARQGQADVALDWLRRAIVQDRLFRARARDDEDFAPLRDEPSFIALIAEPLTIPAVN